MEECRHADVGPREVGGKIYGWFCAECGCEFKPVTGTDPLDSHLTRLGEMAGSPLVLLLRGMLGRFEGIEKRTKDLSSDLAFLGKAVRGGEGIHMALHLLVERVDKLEERAKVELDVDSRLMHLEADVHTLLTGETDDEAGDE